MLTEQTDRQTDRQMGRQRDTSSGSQTDGRHIKAALLAGQQAELDDSHCGLDDNRRGCLVPSLSRSLRCCSLYGKNATIPVLPTHVEGAGEREREVESGEVDGQQQLNSFAQLQLCCRLLQASATATATAFQSLFFVPRVSSVCQAICNASLTAIKRTINMLD